MKKQKKKVLEFDPNGLSPSDPGAKLDANKPLAGLIKHFGLALLEVAKVGTYGAKKYSRGGWLQVEDGVQRYEDAFWRHLLVQDTEPIDKESGLSVESQIAWNALAKLELRLREEKSHV
jgi:hypothetical protein